MKILPPLPEMPISARYDRNRILAGGSDAIASWYDDMWQTRWDMEHGGVAHNVWQREMRNLDRHGHLDFPVLD